MSLRYHIHDRRDCAIDANKFPCTSGHSGISDRDPEGSSCGYVPSTASLQHPATLHSGRSCAMGEHRSQGQVQDPGSRGRCVPSHDHMMMIAFALSLPAHCQPTKLARGQALADLVPPNNCTIDLRPRASLSKPEISRSWMPPNTTTIR